MARNLLVVSFLACLGYTWANPLIDVRIAGGFNAFPNQFPYQAAIYAYIPEYHTPLEDDFCSGSLISPSYVLTTASCLIKAEYVTVILGSQSLDDLDSKAVNVTSSDFVIPENFAAGSYEWNVALIKLGEPVELSDTIKTVPLEEGDDDFAGDLAIVAGWGATYAAQFTVEPVLKWLESVVLSHRQCIKEHSWYKEVVVEGTHICQYATTTSACRGDRGAPLTVDGVQVGLVTAPPANCFRGHPVIYTKVAKYIDWIKKHSDV